ncbi:MAG: Hint domain-containing protein [Roseovarius sp.]|nr:Hint domain-containing protein [Roseovarius sp.]
MAIYTDQTIADNFDPGETNVPFVATIITMQINDADDDGFIRADGKDQVNGSNVTAVWVGDTITLDGIQITGVTFYTADGSRYFTPSDGSVLTDGTITARTFVTKSTQFPLSDLGPPCFVAGTMIAVPGGLVAVENLRPGDRVLTRDHGACPVRWIGQRTVPGVGDFAPVRLAPAALGDHGEIRVSPQHRVLLCDWRAQLFLAEDEVLCPAHMLVNGDTIHRAPCASVTYVHVMFDAHEIVYAEGLATESFLVGDYLCREGTALRAELLSLFPELAVVGGGMSAARRLVRGHEGRLLC